MQFAYKRFFKSNTMRYTVIDLLIPANQSSATISEVLDDGKVVAVALFTDSTPSETVSLGIDDSSNKAIHPPVHYKEFVPTNGNHAESRKALSFSGGRKIKVTLNADDNLQSEFKGQLLFYIEDDNEL